MKFLSPIGFAKVVFACTRRCTVAALGLLSINAVQAQTYTTNFTQAWTASGNQSGMRTPGAGYTVSMFSSSSSVSDGQVMGQIFTDNGQPTGTALSLQVGQTFMIKMGGETSGGRSGLTNGGRIGFTLGSGTSLFNGTSAITRATNDARLRVDFLGGGSSARMIGDSVVTTNMPTFSQFKAGVFYVVEMLSADEFTLRWGTDAGATSAVYNMQSLGGVAGAEIGKIQIYNLGANMGASYSNIVVSNSPYLNFSNNVGETRVISGVISDNGSTANNLVKNGTGIVRIANTNNTYSGSTTVSNGTLIVDGRIGGSGVTVNMGAHLGGSGVIDATIGGAGSVRPGNSPGILTANAVDPTGGLGFVFEFTALNPVYSNATASGNDVLRLTSLTPFTAGFSASNAVDIFFGVASIGAGESYLGGIFTDSSDEFVSDIADATYNYFILGDGLGTDATYEGQGYYWLPNWDAALSIDVSTVGVPTANFADGVVNDGRITQFNVVPEPGTWALVLSGGAVLFGLHWRRRRS